MSQKPTKIPEGMKKLLKNLLCEKFMEKIADLKTQHKNNLHLFKMSYAKQVEELQETIGNMTVSMQKIGLPTPPLSLCRTTEAKPLI